MAEVLITLGIIGIVAAMTLPTVVNKINSKQYKVAYKKAYSSLSNAFLMMKNNGEYLDIETSKDYFGTTIAPNIGENFKTISKYFKAVKTCFNNNADECWQCEGGQAGNLYTSGPDWLGCYQTKSYAFIDASGMSWMMYSNEERPVLVDVNGKQKPNRLGQDRFVLQFAASSDKSSWVADADSIVPWGDIINKGRWCPSGNCLYQTWLLE